MSRTCAIYRRKSSSSSQACIGIARRLQRRRPGTTRRFRNCFGRDVGLVNWTCELNSGTPSPASSGDGAEENLYGEERHEILLHFGWVVCSCLGFLSFPALRCLGADSAGLAQVYSIGYDCGDISCPPTALGSDWVPGGSGHLER